MIRKITYTLAILLFGALNLLAQGIQFETGTWSEVVNKAKAANKPIYVDIYTTWCGPCKVMAASIFPDQQAGTQYNSDFINYKIDAEKGEGIALAQKYKVDGYPTNLYINPLTEEVAYRVMGSCDINEFLNRGKIALEEYKDPKTWDQYLVDFKKGNREETFLKAALIKAERLNKDNALILDAYIAQYMPSQPDSTQLLYLAKHAQTLETKAPEILYRNKTMLNKLNSFSSDYFNALFESMSFSTLKKAIDNKDERLLSIIDQDRERFHIPSKPYNRYYISKDYYQKIGNEAKYFEVARKEANAILSINEAEYKRYNEEELADIRASLLYQLKGLNVPDSLHESSIKANLDKHFSYRMPAYSRSASTLNATAWSVVESKTATKQQIAEALAWSEKSLSLVQNSEDWPMYADTYAQLLYKDGKQQEAIKMETDAVNKAKELAPEIAGELEEVMEKMKSGTL